MTTKKQRREQTAAKTAKRRENDRLVQQQALERSRDKQEQARWERQRAANQKKAKEQIKAVANAKKNEVIPENMQQSVRFMTDEESRDAVLQDQEDILREHALFDAGIPATPSEQLLYDVFAE